MRGLLPHVALLLLAALVMGCTSEKPAEAPPADQGSTSAAGATGIGEQSPYEADKQRVLAMRAPRYAGRPEKEPALAFLQTDVADWVSRRREATNALCDQLQRALEAAVSNDQAALVLRDIAELQLDFAREFVFAGMSAVPESIRSDAELHEAYLAAIVDAVEQQLGTARHAAEHCVQRAARKSSLRGECESTLRAIADVERAQAPTLSDPN